MFDPKKLGSLLAKSAMSKEEKEGWLKLLPFMTEEEAGRLQQTLENEQEKLAALHEEYQKKIEAAVSEA